MSECPSTSLFLLFSHTHTQSLQTQVMVLFIFDLCYHIPDMLFALDGDAPPLFFKLDEIIRQNKPFHIDDISPTIFYNLSREVRPPPPPTHPPTHPPIHLA